MFSSAAVRKQGNDICIWIIRIIFDGRHGKNQPVSFWTMGIRARSCDSVQSKKAHGPEALALTSFNLQQISTHCRTQRKANSKFTWPCYTPHCRAAWPNCKSSSFLLTAPATMNEGKYIVKILYHYIMLLIPTKCRQILLVLGHSSNSPRAVFPVQSPINFIDLKVSLGISRLSYCHHPRAPEEKKPIKDVAISSFYLKHSFQPRVVRALPR